MTNTLAQHARLFSSLDSLEGVPDIFEPRKPVAEQAAWQRKGYNVLAWLADVPKRNLIEEDHMRARMIQLGYLMEKNVVVAKLTSRARRPRPKRAVK